MIAVSATTSHENCLGRRRQLVNLASLLVSFVTDHRSLQFYVIVADLAQ